MIKVMTVVGTRPEAIKLAPVIAELKKHPEDIWSVVCATAQHREMLDQVLDGFQISPDVDLDLMRPNQSLGQLTARILSGLDEVIGREQPDWVLVQGDTTTAMVAALTAHYHGAKVGHVEAGLRTGDKRQPFPEEANRRLIDVLADLYFVPTERNLDNLLRENVARQAIVVTGNTVIDALLVTARHVSEEQPQVQCDWLEGDADSKHLILVTAHRRENFGAPLRNICQALKRVAPG